MDNELDEEEQRRRHRNAGVGVLIDLEPKPRQAANDHPQWQRTDDGAWEMRVGGERVAMLIPNNEPEHPNSWLSNGVGTKDLPEHGWDNVDFGSLEQGKETLEKWWDHAVRGEAYRPERPERPQVTHEAIERDPWNAVALDLPIRIGETDPALLLEVAATARDLRFALGERAEQAVTPGQYELWHHHAERAEARQRLAETHFMAQAHDRPMSAESIDYDPWAAVYQAIPADADAALLQKAHGMAMQCAGAVAGEPRPFPSAFEPDLFGADLPREVNFQNAVQRIDELDGLLRAAERPQQPETELQQAGPPDRLEQPFAEREGRPFQPSEQQPGRYDEIIRTEATTEPATREAGDDDFILQEMRAERAGKEPEAGEPVTREAGDDDIVLQAMRAEREANGNPETQDLTRGAGDDDFILQALREQLAEDEFTRADSRDYEPAPAEQQSDHTRSRTSADDHAGMGHDEEHNAYEPEQEHGDEVEDGHTLEQGGGGRERSLQ